MDRFKSCLLGALVLLAFDCGGGAGTPSSNSGEGSASLSGDGADAAGEADVNVSLNHSPVITSMPARETFQIDGTGKAVSVEAEVSVVASDADGDELSYTWSSPDCPDALFTLSDPSDPASIHFHNDGQDACEVRVEVRDFNRAQAGLPVARRGEAVGRILLSRIPDLRVGA
jgi:hypothetical protein